MNNCGHVLADVGFTFLEAGNGKREFVRAVVVIWKNSDRDPHEGPEWRPEGKARSLVERRWQTRWQRGTFWTGEIARRVWRLA